MENVLEYIINITMEINFSSKVYSKSLLKGSPLSCASLESYLVQKYGGRYFAKVTRIDILSRYMDANILESKRIYILSRSMEADIWRKYCSLIYFVVSIGITTCSIIMDIALVIETAERYFVYFVATKLVSLASYCFHFVVHLFIIY